MNNTTIRYGVYEAAEVNVPKINPELAKEIGLNESLVFLQLAFWLRRTTHIHDGRYWVYKTAAQLHNEAFPYLTRQGITKILDKLCDTLHLLDRRNDLNKRKGDTTYWYALNIEYISRLMSVIVQEIGRTAQTEATELSTEATELSALPSITPSIPLNTNTKEKEGGAATAAPDTSAIDRRNLLLETTKKALDLTGRPYELIAKYTAFLTASLPERDTKNRSNGEWFTMQPSAAADAAEICAFGLWLNDMYDGEPLRKPAAITDYLARFRADEDHGLYLMRAGYTLKPPPPAAPPPAVVADSDEPTPTVDDIEAAFAALVASKSGGKR